MRTSFKRAAVILSVSSALLLSGCSSEKEPTAVAVTQAMPVPSPSWTPPPAGMWTESDLAEGREVPPEEMDRLRPLPEVPKEPDTITHNTEQGAKDAALYFAQVVFAAVAHADATLIEPLLYEYCDNCSDVYEAIKSWSNGDRRFRSRLPEFSITESEPGAGDVPYYVVGVRVSRHAPVELSKSTNVIEKIENVGSVKWFTVQYLDGKWRPFEMSLNEKPDYEE